ncbi:MAG: TIGR03663 family protein [Chloroflexi bacterium]|nr:TIGR03663 family protein [Chloroflexota bacterium]
MTAQTASAARPSRPGPLDRLLAMRIAISWEIALYAALFAAAFALRFVDLGGRALHHDESIHAQWSWRLLQGDYTHDPVFHGPLYYTSEALVFLLFGASDYTSRVSAAIFGMVLVTLPLLIRRWLGPVGTFAAVALIAFSPTLVYYSRFFREDIYMAVFVMLMVAALWRYVEDGRDRWLYLFAFAFTGAMATKEATYLVVAVFLVFLMIAQGAELAQATLAARGTNTTARRTALTVPLAIVAVPVAAFWSYIPGVRRRMDWARLPRTGDVLVLLGTFTLPLLTPVLKVPLERFNVVEKNQLKCSTNISGQNALAIAGLFAMTVGAAAFVGLQWRTKVWAIAGAVSTLAYLTLFTSFWTNLNGVCTGPWGGIDYWMSQQNQTRGEQPWFYYYMLMPMYEFLPLALAIGGVWWSTVRGNIFSRFLWVWLIGMWLALSLAGEKMPWLNVHLALPAALLAAWTVNRAWVSWQGRPRLGTIAIPLLSVAVVAAGGLLLIAFLPGGTTYNALRLGALIAVIGVVAFAAQPYGRRAAGTFAVVAVIGAFSFFSLRTMVMASFVRGDVPKDLLIYTQSSPDITRIATQIDQLAEATGEGYQMRIAVDSTDSFAWPWAWYLRDYKNVGYLDFSNGIPAGEYRVMLVNQSNAAKVDDALASGGGTQFGQGIKYPHRWWFDETYKAAMDVGKGACTAKTGDCGPFARVGPGGLIPWINTGTWSHIASNVFKGDWLEVWAKYWRDKDRSGDIQRTSQASCNSCGSVDAVAYFPANFDLKTGKLTLRTTEPARPSTDKSGNAVFGAPGRQPGQFTSPVDIERDAQGNLYVIDSTAKRLQKFDAAGNFLAAADIRVIPGDLKEEAQPWGLGIAPDGTVVVADTFGWRIRTFTPDLKPTGVTFGKVPNPDPAVPAGPLELYGPRDSAFDRSGNMWVTDGGHDRIVVYTMKGEFVKAIGASGSGQGQFNEPIGIATGGDGSFYIADMFNSRVEILDADGTYRGEFKVPGWGGQGVDDKPYLRVLADGRIAVSLPSLNQVRIYDGQGNLQGTVTGGDEPLSKPYGIVQTPDGKLWIVEGGAGRVRQLPLP